MKIAVYNQLNLSLNKIRNGAIFLRIYLVDFFAQPLQASSRDLR